MSRELPARPDDSDGLLHTSRRLILIVVIAVIVVGPAVHLLHRPISGAAWFQVAAVVPFTCLAVWRLLGPNNEARTPWASLVVIVTLAVALLVVGGAPWIPALAIAGAACGRYASTPVPAVAGSAACAIAGFTVSTIHHFGSGNVFSVTVIGPLAGLLAYSAGRRADTMAVLRRTRADLARAAVAEERLRIARDLHDLLGHSLSLITLKAELAGRVIGSDPARASVEIAELESVARQSLSDVREAVAGFRQPDLAGELSAARQLLDAAGIASQISAADTDGLAQEVDAALAWAVREGTTNVVRHSRATYVAIRVSRGQAAVTAEISDNGPAAPDEGEAMPWPAPVGPDGQATVSRVRPAFAGSGLAGLAERVRDLGGELAAGSVKPQGFLLRVVVPLGPQG
jgi:two-component system, NarL family, sensor histidine kinase DesK